MKKKKIVMSLAALTLVAGSAAALTSCGEEPAKPEPEVVDTLESISVSGATVTFKVGENFSTGNLVVKAKWSVSGEKTLTAAEYTIDSSAVNTAVAGSYNVTVTYQGKKATYAVTVTELQLKDITVNAPNEVVAQNGTFAASPFFNVIATLEDDSTIDVTAGVTISTVDTTTVGVKEATVSFTRGDVTKTSNFDVNVLEVVEISTKEQFLAMRKVSAEAVDTHYYKLTADIDLEGEVLESATTIFGGVFDGQGHKISNALLTNPTAKTGLLFASVNYGYVGDVKFLNCVLNTTNESAGLVTGLCEGGAFVGIEFNSCSAKTSNTYCGLVFARNTKAAEILVTEITAKNGCQTACSQYGGFVTGDMVKGTEATYKNLDIAGEFLKSSGNGSVIAGRCRSGAIVKVDGAIVNVKTDTPAKIGVVTGGGTGQSIEVEAKNIVVTGGNLTAATVSGGTVSIDSCYDATGNEKKVDDFDALAAADFNVAWLQSALKLDFSENGEWMTEGEGKYRLKLSSTNVKSADATIQSLKLATSNTTLRFKKGEEFTSEGLVVMGVYSDGVQLVLNSNEYTVDSTTYNKDADASAGAITYTITVKSVENPEKTATYDVKFVEQTGFRVDDQFMNKVYLAGSELDPSELVVYSVWSDGVEEKLAAKDFKVNADNFDKDAAGEYEITVTNQKFAAQKIKVSVVATAPTVVDKKVYVNVDAAATLSYEGARVDGVETFTKLTNAIDYLTALKLESDVTKVIYVAAGTYTEKITVAKDLTNLTLIGTADNKDDVVLTYSAVEDTVDILSGSQYGLNCATLHVNATGFAAYNLSIRNDFDYINESKNHGSPQGLALTINADGAVLDNVHLYGNQDTLFFKSGRTYIKNSLIEGNVDFIFGEATGVAYFDTCTINAVSRGADVTNTGYVTAMRATSDTKPDYGYIFANCTFTAGEGVKDASMSLGRPWGAKATVAMINCSFTSAYSTVAFDGTAKSRWADMSGNSPVDADFVEYGSTGDGAITAAVAGGKVLTEAEAANYTLANIFAKTNGNVKWTTDFDYASVVTLLENSAKVEGTAFTVSATSVELEKKKTANLTYTVTPWNASDKVVSATIGDDSIISYEDGVIKGLAVGETTITFSYGSAEDVEVTVKVTPSSSKVTATFYNGTEEVGKTQNSEGESLAAPTVTKEGFQFVRWYEDAEFTKAYNSDTLPEEDISLYARFVELNKADVVYAKTAQELIDAIANNKVIYLTQDIDFEGVTYAGKTDNFTGSVYGYGYTIKNWTVTTTAIQQSFFGKAYGGTVEGVVFENFNMTVGASVTQYASIIFTQVYNSEVIENIVLNNCTLDASAAGTGQCGILFESGAGVHNDVQVLKIKNITANNCVVKAGQYSGGLIARCNGSDIELDGLHGTGITFESVGTNAKNAGGVIGHIKAHTFTLKNADIALISIKGVASSSQNLGGVAYMESGSLAISNSTLNIKGTDLNKVAGGIAGLVSAGDVSLSKVTVNVDLNGAGESIGGLFGRFAGALVANKVTVTGKINANYRTGGIAGYVNKATATAEFTDVLAKDLTITNSNADNSGNAFVGKSDADPAIEYTGCSYSNVVVTLGGNAKTIDQGTAA